MTSLTSYDTYSYEDYLGDLEHGFSTCLFNLFEEQEGAICGEREAEVYGICAPFVKQCMKSFRAKYKPHLLHRDKVAPIDLSKTSSEDRFDPGYWDNSWYLELCRRYVPDFVASFPVTRRSKKAQMRH